MSRRGSREIVRMRKRGYQAERELVKILRVMGFKSVRIPVSASGNKPLPDVFATAGKCIIAFEVKSSSADRVYFSKDQVEKLFSFLDLFDAYSVRMAILTVKFPHKWVFKRIDKSDSYSIHKGEESNVKLEAIVG